MKRKEVHEKMLGGPICENYCIAVWSKLKLDENMGEE